MAPLSIRTKVRSMGAGCLLEACLECLKPEGPLVLDYVHFEPVKRYTSTPVDLKQDDLQQGPLKDYINAQTVKVMGGHHCTRNFLFRLDPVTTGITQGDLEVKTLGKLEIKWRTGFGETGRLQTQQIQGYKTDEATPDEVQGHILSVNPQNVTVYHPFQIVVRLANFAVDSIGPIAITLPRGDEVENSAIRMSGHETVKLRELPGGETRDVQISLVSFRSGIQTINNLKLIDETTGGIVGTVLSHDLFIAPFRQ